MSTSEVETNPKPSQRSARQRYHVRVLHLNSMLKGGGTDDRSVKIAYALMNMGQWTAMAGPVGRDFSKVVTGLNIPFFPVPLGPLKLPFIVRTAALIRRERIG